MKRWAAGVLVALGAGLAQYSDVGPDRPEWLALQTLTEMGVMHGYPDGKFRPNRVITRGEVAMALYRLWLRAKERQDETLQDALKRFGEAVLALGEAQGRVEERLEGLEKEVKGRLSPEDKEEILAEVASARSVLGTLEETLSRLVEQYLSLEGEMGRAKEVLAAVDQRSLAWNEDAASLQRQVGEARKALEDLARELKALETRVGGLEEGKRQLQEAGERRAEEVRKEAQELRRLLQEAAQGLEARAASLEARIGEARKSLEELEGRLNQTREELFRLGEEVRRGRQEVRERLGRLEYQPSPLQVGGLVGGISPLALSLYVGHDQVLGTGVRLGGEWNAGTGELLVYGGVYLPIFREPTRGQVGFGLAYSFSGPYAGGTEILSFLGIGIRLTDWLEGVAEARYLFPLDGATPRGRLGGGVRIRP